MPTEKDLSMGRRLVSRLMPSSVRSGLLSLLNFVIAAITIASLVVAAGSEFGWPMVWSVLRVAGVVVAIAASILLHVLTLLALRREIDRADLLHDRAGQAADALVQMSELGKEQAEAFQQFIGGKGGRLGEIEQQALELRASGVKLEKRQAEIQSTLDELMEEIKEIRKFAD